MGAKQNISAGVNLHSRGLWLTQFKALVEKEWLIRFVTQIPHSYCFIAIKIIYYFCRKRKARLHSLLLFCSCLCVFFVWSFQKAFFMYQQIDSAQNATEEALMFPFPPEIPNCEQNAFIRKDVQCYSLLYAPDTEEFSAMVRQMCQNNQPILDQRLVQGFPSGNLMDEYLYEHPNTVIAAVEFFKESNSKYAFSVQTNGTVRWFKGKFQEPHKYAQIPIVLAIQKAFATKIAGRQIGWQVRVGNYPHSPTVCDDWHIDANQCLCLNTRI